MLLSMHECCMWFAVGLAAPHAHVANASDLSSDMVLNRSVLMRKRFCHTHPSLLSTRLEPGGVVCFSTVTDITFENVFGEIHCSVDV